MYFRNDTSETELAASYTEILHQWQVQATPCSTWPTKAGIIHHNVGSEAAAITVGLYKLYTQYNQRRKQNEASRVPDILVSRVPGISSFARLRYSKNEPGSFNCFM